MIDSIKKAILAGVGAAAVTTEKVEKTLNELVAKGKLSATDAKAAARKLSEEGRQEFEEASRMLEQRFDSTLKKMGRGHEERIEKLETKLAVLESRLAALEAEETAAAATKK